VNVLFFRIRLIRGIRADPRFSARASSGCLQTRSKTPILEGLRNSLIEILCAARQLERSLQGAKAPEPIQPLGCEQSARSAAVREEYDCFGLFIHVSSPTIADIRRPNFGGLRKLEKMTSVEFRQHFCAARQNML
jgi:hypothetical protein